MKNTNWKKLLLIATLLTTNINADQVILDDLIINGSECIGQDCVNGESFGFDTLRLKENNLRIKFIDTSSSASFPSNDWEITVNDSTNGGSNSFAITDIDGGKTPFKIMAGAPSSSIYVSESGKVGFGTGVPSTDLHIKAGNTPSVRIEQDSNSGYTAQTWDIGTNEVNFFIKDYTQSNTALPFRIQTGSPDNSIVVKPTEVAILKDATIGGSLTVTGNIISRGSVFNASDKNLKENILKIDDSIILKKLEGLDISSWNYKSENKSIQHIGPMAQDFYKIFNVGVDNKHIAALDAAAIAIAGVKALSKQLKIKDDEIALLQKQIEEFKVTEERIQKIEDFIAKSSIFKTSPREIKASRYQDSE